jgi:hypothetical protein
MNSLSAMQKKGWTISFSGAILPSNKAREIANRVLALPKFGGKIKSVEWLAA